jgi:hypothetical protein
MALLRNAAGAVPPERRDAFLQRVARHLTGEPTDHAVQAAVQAALDSIPVFSCDDEGEGQ